jgi:gamma-glutamyltranspeptidase/glutathione hydrolase
LAEGDTIRNAEQAGALRLIARDGARAFYEGPIADAIVEAVARAGGELTRDDLRAFAPTWTPPLVGGFRGRTLFTMPPPSNGGVATIQTLEIIDRFAERRGVRVERLDRESADYVHLVVESMKHAFADRAEWFGDPAFVDVPVAGLLSDAYLDDLAARIDPGVTQAPEHYGSRVPPPDDGGTSHFCVIDERGLAVACTETINLAFGSCIAVEPYGFLLNNEMDDFTTIRGGANAFGLRQSERNLPAPGKRPLSSMSPTIVVAPDGAVEFIAGGSGGPRIITGVVQSLLNAMVFGMPAGEAIAARRFHHQWWPDRIAFEATWAPDTTRDAKDIFASAEGITEVAHPQAGSGGAAEAGTAVAALHERLRAKGHALAIAEDVGAVQMIQRAGDGYRGASDPRKGGAPAGRR